MKMKAEPLMKPKTGLKMKAEPLVRQKETPAASSRVTKPSAQKPSTNSPARMTDTGTGGSMKETYKMMVKPNVKRRYPSTSGHSGKF